MKILRGAELPKNKGLVGIFPSQWYVIEDDGTISGPFASAEQAEEASKTPAMTLERLNDFLNDK
jgi:hypothetical protein